MSEAKLIEEDAKLKIENAKLKIENAALHQFCEQLSEIIDRLMAAARNGKKPRT
jgi:Asp-tRNA(Asn)/Glu-tRNA(Gln) amidotransferase C subunit